MYLKASKNCPPVTLENNLSDFPSSSIRDIIPSIKLYFCTCKNQQTSANTPSCVFSWDLHLYAAPYSYYTRLPFYVFLHLYKFDVTDLKSLWNRTQSPGVHAYIFTTVNVPSFSSSTVSFIVIFLNTNTVYCYIVIPVITEAFYYHYLSSCSPTIVLLHPLQHLLHFTKPSPKYMQNSFRKSLLQNDVPPSI